MGLVILIIYFFIYLSSGRIWAAAVDALTSFLKCFVSPNSFDSGILLQPVLVYLSRYAYCHKSHGVFTSFF